MKKKLKRKIPKIFRMTLPIWMVLVLLFNFVAASGIVEYYLMKKNFDAKITALSKSVKDPKELIQILKAQVLPQNGHVLSVNWDDIASKLIETGAIDEKKFKNFFAQDPGAKKYMKYLSERSHDHMIISEENGHFMLNTLWALGLVSKSQVLDHGTMKTYGNHDPMSFASTGGWDLGREPTSKIYSSAKILKLSPGQEEAVKRIAGNIYRACCDNSTEFPDCNHGMAALGYIEAAVAQGVSENQIYKDLLVLNSFWFPRQYVSLAYFMKNEGWDWREVDPKLALSAKYSSGTGIGQVEESLQALPGLNVQGGGCGA